MSLPFRFDGRTVEISRPNELATSRSSYASVSSARRDDTDDLARRRMWQSSYQIEGLVRDNRVEVRVLFGASEGPAKRGFSRL